MDSKELLLYADNIKKRLQQLNRSECIPYAFRIYATYEVSSRLSDLKIHSIIDKLNPNLRSIENFDGKKFVREFYAMSPEDAYSILEAISEIHGCSSKLKLATLTEKEVEAEQIAEEIQTETQERAENFMLSKCQIPIGATIECCNAGVSGVFCTVVDDRMVEYEGKKMYLTSLAKQLVGKKNTNCWTKIFQIQWRMAK